jgi:hypothetical protein
MFLARSGVLRWPVSPSPCVRQLSNAAFEVDRGRNICTRKWAEATNHGSPTTTNAHLHASPTAGPQLSV